MTLPQVEMHWTFSIGSLEMAIHFGDSGHLHHDPVTAHPIGFVSEIGVGDE